MSDIETKALSICPKSKKNFSFAGFGIISILLALSYRLLFVITIWKQVEVSEHWP